MKTRVDGYTIGQLAKVAGVNVETVRYYQRRGFLVKPTKRGVGYRKYGEDDARRILFIKEAQRLGFSLVEAKDLLSLRVSARTRCQEVREMAEGKISEIKIKIASLENMQRALERIAGACRQSEPTATCPILEALEPVRLGQAALTGNAKEV